MRKIIKPIQILFGCALIIATLFFSFQYTVNAQKKNCIYQCLGDKGVMTKLTQQRLNEIRKQQGLKPIKEDGKYGKETEEAVKEFQRKNGLDDDGEAGPLTAKELFEGKEATSELVKEIINKFDQEGYRPRSPEVIEGLVDGGPTNGNYSDTNAPSGSQSTGNDTLKYDFTESEWQDAAGLNDAAMNSPESFGLGIFPGNAFEAFSNSAGLNNQIAQIKQELNDYFGEKFGVNNNDTQISEIVPDKGTETFSGTEPPPLSLLPGYAEQADSNMDAQIAEMKSNFAARTAPRETTFFSDFAKSVSNMAKDIMDSQTGNMARRQQEISEQNAAQDAAQDKQEDAFQEAMNNDFDGATDFPISEGSIPDPETPISLNPPPGNAQAQIDYANNNITDLDGIGDRTFLETMADGIRDASQAVAAAGDAIRNAITPSYGTQTPQEQADLAARNAASAQQRAESAKIMEEANQASQKAEDLIRQSSPATQEKLAELKRLAEKNEPKPDSSPSQDQTPPESGTEQPPGGGGDASAQGGIDKKEETFQFECDKNTGECTRKQSKVVTRCTSPANCKEVVQEPGETGGSEIGKGTTVKPGAEAPAKPRTLANPKDVKPIVKGGKVVWKLKGPGKEIGPTQNDVVSSATAPVYK